jgi:hypothetical protein
MLDVDRLKRNHVFTVRCKDGKFFVVVTDKNCKEFWEIPWDTWVKEGRNALKD